MNYIFLSRTKGTMAYNNICRNVCCMINSWKTKYGMNTH